MARRWGYTLLAGAASLLCPVIPAEGAANASVAIQDFQFSPSSVTVQVGNTVTWSNGGQAPHSVAGAGFDSSSGCSTTEFSGCMMSGDSFSHTFAAAGSFSYQCEVHPSMSGTVTVEAAPTTTAPPATTTTAPPPVTTTAPPRTTTTTAPPPTTTATLAPVETTTTAARSSSTSTSRRPTTTTEPDDSEDVDTDAASSTTGDGGDGGFPLGLVAVLVLLAVGAAGGFRYWQTRTPASHV